MQVRCTCMLCGSWERADTTHRQRNSKQCRRTLGEPASVSISKCTTVAAACDSFAYVHPGVPRRHRSMSALMSAGTRRWTVAELTPALLPEFQALHSRLLPVQYDEKFYQKFFTSKTHVALVATVPDADADGATARRVVAFISVSLRKVHSYCGSDLTAYVMTLGTDERYRGMGIASDLLSRILDKVGYGSLVFEVSLHCTTSNTSAIQLYEKFGFRRTKMLSNHYRFHGALHDAYELVLLHPNNRFFESLRRSFRCCCCCCCLRRKIKV